MFLRKKCKEIFFQKKKIAKRWMRDYFISKRILNWDVLKINITFVGGQKLVPVDLHGLQLTSLAQSISNLTTGNKHFTIGSLNN